MNLRALIASPDASIVDIARALDGCSHAERMAALADTTRADQRALFEKAGRGAPVTLDDMVPPDKGPLEQVVHHGRNTLPLPPSWRFFEKRFCRPDDGTARAFGYNESPTRGLLGPGYFVLVSTSGRPEWQQRGAFVVDYFQVPDGRVVAGWPAVVPNSKGLQTFVYRGTRDFLRKVSAHVTIGIAYKGERSLDHYFTLCRNP